MEPVQERAKRIVSLDIVRGIAMVLMAIDHVRVYAGVPAGGPNPGVFFTRWVTNFSAPVFAFFAGTGAYFHAKQLGSTSELSVYLLKRGALLVLLELTYLRLAWTFNIDVTEYNLAGVIWMLGWCMIVLAGLVRFLSARTIGAIGLVMIIVQPVFGPISNALPATLGGILYLGGQVHIGSLPMDVLYVLIPWVGVMAVGYAFGEVMSRPETERRRLCLRIGTTATALFVAIGAAIAVSKRGGEGPPLLFRVLNQQKYPPSVLFLLMTLGPAIAFLPVAENMQGLFAKVMETFGRVPMFFYLLHIPLIHALALVVSLIREGHVNPWLFGNFPMEPGKLPEGYRWSLGLLYLVFVVAIAILYPVCRWYSERKRTRPVGWMRYI